MGAAAVQQVAAGAAQDGEHQVSDERVDVEPQRAPALLGDQRGDRVGELGDLGLGLAAQRGVIVDPAPQVLEQRPAVRVRDRLGRFVGLGQRRGRHGVVFARIDRQIKSVPRIEPTAIAWYSAPVQALAWARGSMTLLYDWLKKAAKAQGNNKAVVYRDNYLSWRGLLHRVDRRAQEFKSMGIKEGAWVGLMLGNVPDFVILALALSRARRGDRADRSDHRRPRARADPRRGAAARAGHPTARQRGLDLARTGPARRCRRARCRARACVRPSPPPASFAPSSTSGAPAGDAAEVRRRLQGTLLTCSVYKRIAAGPRRRSDRGAVHGGLARRSEGRAAHRQEHDRGGRSRDRRARR